MLGSHGPITANDNEDHRSLYQCTAILMAANCRMSPSLLIAKTVCLLDTGFEMQDDTADIRENKQRGSVWVYKDTDEK